MWLMLRSAIWRQPDAKFNVEDPWPLKPPTVEFLRVLLVASSRETRRYPLAPLETRGKVWSRKFMNVERIHNCFNKQQLNFVGEENNSSCSGHQGWFYPQIFYIWYWLMKTPSSGIRKYRILTFSGARVLVCVVRCANCELLIQLILSKNTRHTHKHAHSISLSRITQNAIDSILLINSFCSFGVMLYAILLT